MKLEQYKVRDVQINGISKIIRAAEEHGLVVITKNNMPSAMLIPLSRKGFARYISKFRDLLGDDLRADDAKPLNDMLIRIEEMLEDI